MDSANCRLCGALLPIGFGSCHAIFETVCVKEYSDIAYGAVHLLTVDAYALQHSEEHGPRSNAFHLLRLCRLVECGENPGIGQRPRRSIGKALEKEYRWLPVLAPPSNLGSLTVADVVGAENPEVHAAMVQGWARSVWDAYVSHHEWARAHVRSGAST